MQNGSEPDPDTVLTKIPLAKAERYKAQRAEAIALGIKNSGNAKRKTRAARNGNDKLRRTEAEAKVKELTTRVKALEADDALRSANSDRSPLTSAPRGLVWPAAAATAPAPQPAPASAPRSPSPARTPIDDYEEPARAATASPEPEDHGSDEDGHSLVSNGSACASPVWSPSP